MPDDGSIFGRALRVPPANIRAEQALLGALLSNNRAAEYFEGLKPEHFYDSLNGQIFAAIMRRIDAGRAVDAVILQEEFDRKYLVSLLGAMVGINVAGEYALEIANKAKQRALIDYGEEVIERAYSSSPDMDAARQLDLADQKLTEISSDDAADRDPGVSLAAAMTEAINEGDLVSQGIITGGVPSGIPSLDSRVGGLLRGGKLFVIGGRPSMGKSALAATIAKNVSCGLGHHENGAPRNALDDAGLALVFSTEVAPKNYAAGVAAQMTGVSSKEILLGRYPDVRSAGLVRRAQQRIEQAPLVLFSTPSPTFSFIARKCRKVQRLMRRPIRLVVVDYLQRMAYPSGVRDRRVAVGENANRLKDLSVELDCTVIALSQINRGVEHREDRRPTMADLMESGDIEAAADVVGLLYREGYYVEKDKPKPDPEHRGEAFEAKMAEWEANFRDVKNKGELILAKVREDLSGEILSLYWHGPRTLFWDTAAGPYIDGEPI